MVGYVRVSTEEQAREGVSMDAERERLEAYCIAQGYELVGIESSFGLVSSWSGFGFGFPNSSSGSLQLIVGSGSGRFRLLFAFARLKQFSQSKFGSEQ